MTTKRIRRIILTAAFIALLVSIVLLLNFTAPNPTGRRYSSRVPLTTGQGSSNAIGLDGERVLADDLHLPRNDAPDQLQCICNSPGYTNISNCRVCIVSAQLTSPFRRPDFVAPNFIAEAKNAQNLYYDSRDLTQITDFAIAARALNRPLWVYTRVNTDLDPEFIRIVGTTGGGVVPYFSVPDYVDSVDQAAKTVAAVFAPVLLLMLLLEFGTRRMVRTAGSPRPPKQSRSPLNAAQSAVEQADKFGQESKDKGRARLD